MTDIKKLTKVQIYEHLAKLIDLPDADLVYEFRMELVEGRLPTMTVVSKPTPVPDTNDQSRDSEEPLCLHCGEPMIRHYPDALGALWCGRNDQTTQYSPEPPDSACEVCGKLRSKHYLSTRTGTNRWYCNDDEQGLQFQPQPTAVQLHPL